MALAKIAVFYSSIVQNMHRPVHSNDCSMRMKFFNRTGMQPANTQYRVVSDDQTCMGGVGVWNWSDNFSKQYIVTLSTLAYST